MTSSHQSQPLLMQEPDIKISVRQAFGIDSDMEVPAFSEADSHVPDIDDTYRFDRETTMAILAGFAHNRRVMIQGYHGTGKSTHIEQVAARLNWPCVRVNLDSHISPYRPGRQGRHRLARTASRSPSFAKAFCRGRLQNPTAHWCLTNTMPVARRHVRDPARAGARGKLDAA